MNRLVDDVYSKQNSGEISKSIINRTSSNDKNFDLNLEIQSLKMGKALQVSKIPSMDVSKEMNSRDVWNVTPLKEM